MNNGFIEQAYQDPDMREQQLLARLPAFLQYAKQESSYYRELLAAIDCADVNTREQLALLPITPKSALKDLQAKQPPLAGLDAAKGKLSRLFQSPGPINEPEHCIDDWWRMGQAFQAAGFEPGDIVQNCLSYHLTPGGFILDSGARACGCTVIPAGPGQTQQQLEVIAQLQPQGYCGTPSFLKILLDKAKATQQDCSSIRKALLTGEALPESLREEFLAQGISALQAYASADIGLIAYETLPSQGFVIAEEIIVEIVRPGSSQPVKAGEVGEVVVTSFNVDYPLIRFATGDLSALLLEPSPCGRTNQRLKGWLGRADQSTKVKGMFVHPEQIEKIRKAFTRVEKMRLMVSQTNHNDVMSLHCELDISALNDEQQMDLSSKIADYLQQVTKLNGQVKLYDIGSLANDGKVIEDIRNN